MKRNITFIIGIILSVIFLSPSLIAQNMDGGTITTSDSQIICSQSPQDSRVKVQVSGKKGNAFVFLMIDEADKIVLTQKSGNFKFKDADSGIYTIYHVSHDKKDFTATVGMNFGDITGTFDLSNPLEIVVSGISESTISYSNGETDIEVCAEGTIIEIESEGEPGENTRLVVVGKSKKIMLITDGNSLDIASLEEDRYTIYQINYNGELTGLEVGGRLNKVEGCHALSNGLSLSLASPEAGEIQGDTQYFCVGNNSPDKIHGNDLKLVGESKGKGKWVLTDSTGIIMDIFNNPHQPNFDKGEPGTCYLWYVAGNPEGLNQGENLENLSGCYDLSNSIEIVKTLANGGELDHGIVKICAANDSTLTFDEAYFELSGAEGAYFSWIVTTRNKTIIGFGEDMSAIDLSDAGTDKFFVYHLAYNDDLSGLEVGNRISDLEGCFDLSNQVPVNLESVSPATLDGSVALACGGEIDTSDLAIINGSSDNLSWIITDQEGNILHILDDLSGFDFDEDLEAMNIYLLNYNGELTGFSIGDNINNLSGCFSLSNPISISGSGVDGGLLEGGPFSFCLDSSAAFIPDSALLLSGNEGPLSSWIITDTSGTIMDLPVDPYGVNFGEFGQGTCLIWHISYEEGITGLAVDSNAFDLGGCFDLSNSILVSKDSLDGGIISGGPFAFCSDTSSTSLQEGDILLEGAMGGLSTWLVTDSLNNIKAISDSPYEINYIALGPGTYLLWHLSYSSGITGLAINNNIENVSGCFDLSNSIEITNGQPSAGTLSGGPFTYCSISDVPEFLTNEDITLSDTMGGNSNWILTDSTETIVAISDSISGIVLSGIEFEILFIYHLTYADSISGLLLSNQLLDLQGCFDLSNSIEISVSSVEGGTLTGGPFEICAGDGEPDLISAEELELSGNSGNENQWVITDSSGVIVGLPDTLSAFDFDTRSEDLLLILNLSYQGNIEGLNIDSLTENLTGCFDFSNSISVFVDLIDGGMIEFEDGTVDTTFCADDGIDDLIEADRIGAEGENMSWIITDSLDIITVIADSLPYNVEGGASGIYSLWSISYNGNLDGFSVDSLVENIEGCFSLSNPITITLQTGDECTDLGGFADSPVEDERLIIGTRQNLVQSTATLDIQSKGSLGRGVLVARNMDGQILYIKNIQITESQSITEQIDTEGWNSGVYFITVTFPGEVKTIKIIKQE